MDGCTKEFQTLDKGRDDLHGKVNMTKAHYDAIVAAKSKLGLR